MGVAASFGVAAAGSGAAEIASLARSRGRYWSLLSGGDGADMTAMLDAFREANPGIAVKDSTLQWGNPYCSKLAMAAAGSRAPDLAVMHLGRMAGFAPGRLLDPFDVRLPTRYGVHAQEFDPVLWKRATVDGKLYALPLDIHVQLTFYRKDVCAKAGLLDGKGELAPITSTDAWFDAFAAARKATSGSGMQTLGIKAADVNFSWWFFVSFCTQRGGAFYDHRLTDLAFDVDKATEILEFLRRHVVDAYSRPVPVAVDAEQFLNGSPSPGRATGPCLCSAARRWTPSPRPRGTDAARSWTCAWTHPRTRRASTAMCRCCTPRPCALTTAPSRSSPSTATRTGRFPSKSPCTARSRRRSSSTPRSPTPTPRPATPSPSRSVSPRTPHPAPRHRHHAGRRHARRRPRTAVVERHPPRLNTAGLPSRTAVLPSRTEGPR